MRLLDTFGLVDGRVNRIVLAFKLGVVLRPHAVDDLAGLSEHAHPVAKLGEAKAISPPLVLVPACSDASIQPAMAGDVHRRGDLGIQRRVTVTVTADHLPDLDILCVAGEGGRDRPALEAGLKLRCGNGMEVVEDPDGIPPSLIGHACDPRHGLVLFDGIVDLRQVHAPPLRYEDSESEWHHLSPFSFTSSARAQVESLPISQEVAWWSRPAPPRRDLYLHTRRLCRHRSLPLVAGNPQVMTEKAAHRYSTLRNLGHAGLGCSAVCLMTPENMPLPTLGTSANARSRCSGSNPIIRKRPAGTATSDCDNLYLSALERSIR